MQEDYTVAIDFKGGRLPNDPDKPRVRLAPFLRHASSLPPMPILQDWGSRVTDWGMALNDRMGDCTVADIAHTLKQTSLYATGSEVSIPDSEVVAAYSAISGYDPATGANDNGAIMQDVQNYWRKTGVGGHKSLAFAEVDVTNLDEVYAAINVFGSVHLGMDFPQSAMDQFNRGQGWTLSDINNQVVGGHDVVGVGYDKTRGVIYVVTWGRLIPVTNEFFKKYFVEGWVSIIPEWLDVTGHNPLGLDLQGLGQAVSDVTGKPNPFPAPLPPLPPPPGPPLTDPDLILWAAVLDWAHARHIKTNKTAAAAVLAWAKSKKLA